MSNLVNADELATLLKVTPATVHAWHRRGWIPCLQAGRRPVLFDVAAVEQAMRARGEQKVADHADHESSHYAEVNSKMRGKRR